MEKTIKNDDHKVLVITVADFGKVLCNRAFYFWRLGQNTRPGGSSRSICFISRPAITKLGRMLKDLAGCFKARSGVTRLGRVLLKSPTKEKTR